MSEQSNLTIVRGNEVSAVLDGQERVVIDRVRAAYEVHEEGRTALPHSSFLRFPGEGHERDRIIALPAYLGGSFQTAGIKWISSFPGNLEKGIERASAALILNSMEDGRPMALLESSVISAKRTAASAALAAATLHADGDASRVGLIGCGPINFEVVRFLLAALPDIRTVVLYDRDPARAEGFAARCAQLDPALQAEFAGSVEEVLGAAALVSFATTAATPHVGDLGDFPASGTILHVSLRDLSPEVILACDNVVDDVDHVCRADTSIDLASRRAGNRDFVRCTLGQVTRGSARPRADSERPVVFSPFGLGILDLAVGEYAYRRAVEQGMGMDVPDFYPDPWLATAPL